MGAYILRRLFLMIPTILGIMFISFVIIQFAPGGPIERIVADLTGQSSGATERVSGGILSLSKSLNNNLASTNQPMSGFSK